MKRFILLVLVCTIANSNASAQPTGVTSDGTDFYFAVLPSSVQCPSTPTLFLNIASYYRTHVDITYFDSLGNEMRANSILVTPDRALRYQLAPVGLRLKAADEVVQYRAWHIRSDFPISVSYSSFGYSATATFLVLPTPALGKHYVIASHPSNHGEGSAGNYEQCDTYGRDSGSSCFLIVAAHDSTNVTISPNATTYAKHIQGASTGSHSDGSVHPIHVRLDRGQTYWVRSETSQFPADMSGSRVDADRPIAVVAGNSAASVDTLEAPAGQHGQPSRNLMLQQMIPLEYLSAHDHPAMPFVDFPSSDTPTGVTGDFLRVFAADSNGATTTVKIEGSVTQQYPLNAFGFGPSLNSITKGANLTATSPIMVEQYDYREQGDTAGTTPTMMNVLAIEQWKRNYAMLIQGAYAARSDGNFINVIAQPQQFDKINVFFNHENPRLLSSYKRYGSDANIPGHSPLDPLPLIGRRFLLPEGSYRFTADSGFAVYQYGFAHDDLHGDKFVYEYATPAGEQFFAQRPGSIGASVTRDACGGWLISASESDSLNMGLAQIELLNDPLGVYSTPGMQSLNTAAISSDVIGKTQAVFQVSIVNPFLDAYAAVRVLSRTGKDTILELGQTGINAASSVDKFVFSRSVGTDTCASFVVHNISDALARVFTFTGASVVGSDTTVKVISTFPSLPAKFNRGDSLQVNFCYAPSDTLKAFDSLVLSMDCSSIKIPITVSATTPLIYVGDLDFGHVALGTSKCQRLRVSNIGTSELTITGATIFGAPDLRSKTQQYFRSQSSHRETVWSLSAIHPSS
jgi:hypothetical protein